MGILSKFFDKDEFTDVDTKLDDLINKIPLDDRKYSSEEGTGKVIDSFISSLDSNNDISKLYQSITVPTDRLARYTLYEEMYKIVPIIKRIVKTYIANILPKNPTDGKCIIYKDVPDAPDDKTEYLNVSKDYLKDLISHFNIIEKYKNIILPRRLLYGDCFVEIVDVSKELPNIDLNKSFDTTLNEINTGLSGLSEFSSKKSVDSYLQKIIDCFLEVETPVNSIEKTLDKLKNIETDQIDSEDDKINKPDDPIIKKYKHTFDNVIIKIHNTSDIIILTTKYGSKIGYLEVIKSDAKGQSYTQSLTAVLSKVSSLGRKNDMTQDALINKMILFILKKIMTKIKKTNPGTDDSNEALMALNPDVYLFIKKLFIEQGLYNKNIQNTMKVRFIPPNRMVQFKTSSIDNDPYGESIIDGIILPCKLYTIAQLSNTVSKLSRAALVRKWTLEVGSSKTHSQQIQKFRRELNNTKLTLNDFSSFKSIPKLFSDFKDMVILSNNGQKALDVSVQNIGEASINVADLEDARKEIIALSGIPAPYIGYMDQVELKEQLVHTNVSFATEIIDMQEHDILALNRLAEYISNIQDMSYQPTNYVQISLIPPVVLVLQLIEMVVASIGNIASVFMNIGKDMSPDFFLRQYVPHLDWDLFDQYLKEKELHDKTKEEIAASSGAPAPAADDGSGGGY